MHYTTSPFGIKTNQKKPSNERTTIVNTHIQTSIRSIRFVIETKNRGLYSMNASARILQNQLKELTADPIEGFMCELADESNLYVWNVYLKGPGDTCYEGGIYKAQLTFPQDYPYSPPKLKFLSEIWHPNIYKDGNVCISILHPPGEDEMSGERPEERWLPTQNASTIILSLLSMLSDPNIYSPANVDAAKMYRDERDKFNAYNRKLAQKTLLELPQGFKMPEPKKYVPVQEMGIEEEDVYELDSTEEDEDTDDGEEEENEEEIDLENLTEEERKLLEEAAADELEEEEAASAE